MGVMTLRNSRGQMVAVESYSATAAKNSFGAIMDKAVAEGMVAITRHDKARVVVLSIEEYRSMLARLPDELETLRVEFDDLVGRLQKPRARAAGRALFKARPAALGKAAVADARKRG